MTALNASSNLEDRAIAAVESLIRECQRGDGVFVAIANRARESGLLLDTIKAREGHGRWLQWIARQPLLSPDKAQRLISIYKRHKHEFTDPHEACRFLKDAKVACGHMRLPGREHPQTARFYSFVGTLTKHTMNIQGAINKEIETEPIENWSKDRQFAVLDQLKPLVQLYDKLCADEVITPAARSDWFYPR